MVVPSGSEAAFLSSIFLSKSKIFLILCLSFILGVFLGKYINQMIMAIAAMIFVMMSSLFWENKIVRILAFCGIVAALGAFRFASLVSQENQLAPFYSQKIEAKGIVREEPDVRSSKIYLTVSDLVVGQQPVEGKVLLSVSRFPEFNYGDEINFTGKIQEPRDAEVKGEFSYKNYLSRFGISAVMYYPKIEVINVGQGNMIKSKLLSFKNHLVTKLNLLLPEPENSFLLGILLGLRRTIPQGLLEQFNITSTTHIIALSGFNITIIAWAIDSVLLWFLSRRVSFAVSLLAILAFIIMTGASASVVRAGIMGAIGMLALNIGRVNQITNALVLAASLMLLQNPKILHFDVGFQLSFAAMLGLIYLAPLFKHWRHRVPKFINTVLVPTLAAQIFTLPILLYNFDRISLIAPLTNVLVLPLIPVAMLLGFLTSGLSLIFLPLAQLAAWLTWVVLAYVIKVVELTSKIPLASMELKNVHLIFLVIYYLILVKIIWKDQQRPSYSF